MSLNSAAVAISVALCAAAASAALAQTPASVAAEGETLVTSVHAEGAQIYECAAAADGALAWKFREPIATLLRDGKTVGRHFAGPSWEFADSSLIEAKAAGNAPGATPQDIPLLKLTVSAHRGAGILADVTTVQRLATRGGVRSGPCPTAGAVEAVAYGADYVFLKK